MARQRKEGYFCETKTITVEDLEYDLIRFEGEDSWKIHNWEGPAVRSTDGVRKKSRYYLYGFEYDKELYGESIKEREGLPWYKNPAMKGVERF